MSYLPVNTTEAELIIPELIMLAGLIAIILIPNLGDATFRIPLSRIKVPVLLGCLLYTSDAADE